MKCLRIYKTTYPPPVEGEDYCPDGESELWQLFEFDDLEEDQTDVEIVIEQIKEHGGSVEASSYPTWHPGVWYKTVDAEQDYSTGEWSEYTFHLEAFSEAEQRQIFDHFRRG